MGSSKLKIHRSDVQNSSNSYSPFLEHVICPYSSDSKKAFPCNAWGRRVDVNVVLPVRSSEWQSLEVGNMNLEIYRIQSE